MNADQLPALMQRLPQEIFDNIYQLVFTAASEPRQIDKHYRPPVQLQVDRASRKTFARIYYGDNSTFVLDSSIQIQWACSLPAAHFDKITRIRYPHACGDLMPLTHESSRIVRKKKAYHLMYLMECFGFGRAKKNWVSFDGQEFVFHRKKREYGKTLRSCWRLRVDSKGVLFERY